MVLMVGTIIGLARFIDSSQLSPTPSRPGFQGAGDPVKAKSQGLALLTLDQIGQSKVLESKQLGSDKAQELVKFDSKVQFGRIRPTDTTALYLESLNFGGKIVALGLNSPFDKKELKDQISSALAPAISRSHDRFAYLSFSNAELDFGFQLVVESVDGSQKQIVFRSASGIGSYFFSPDDRSILAAELDVQNQDRIVRVDLESLKMEELYLTSDRILDFDWTDSWLVVAQAPRSKDAINQSELFEVRQGQAKALTNNAQAELYPRLSPDGKSLAYLSVDFPSGKLSTNQSGEASLLNLVSQNVSKLGPALQVVGWSKINL